jgi:uncharacterized protein (TIGR02271 family)
VTVSDRDGLRGTVDAASQPALDARQGQVLVHLDNGEQALVPADELRPQPDGNFTLPFSLSELARGGATEATLAADDGRTRVAGTGRRVGVGGGESGERVVVPVIAEQLDVQKRKVERGGVRIRKIVHEREEIVDEPLIREEVNVKRVPINRVVEGPIPVRHVGDTMIISLLEEVLVVEKRLMLKEELHITKGEVETFRPQRIMLRTEEARIERVGEEPEEEGGGAPGAHAE